MTVDQILARARAIGRDLGAQQPQQMFGWLMAMRHDEIASLTESVLLASGAELAPEASRTAAYVDLADVLADDHTELLHRLRDREAEHAKAFGLVMFMIASSTVPSCVARQAGER